MNSSFASKPGIANPVVTALLVSPFSSDHAVLREVFSDWNWKLHTAPACSEALALLRRATIPVVVCERNLRDGDWKTILGATARMAQPPRLIVSSRLVDFKLLSEVRSTGGYSVVASPFDAREIDAKIQLAWHSWRREWRNTGDAWPGTASPSAQDSVEAATTSPLSGLSASCRGPLDFD